MDLDQRTGEDPQGRPVAAAAPLQDAGAGGAARVAQRLRRVHAAAGSSTRVDRAALLLMRGAHEGIGLFLLLGFLFLFL